MYRFIEKSLKNWQESKKPNPILLRGARQVGKTYIIEKFAKENFSNYIYINFEFEAHLKNIFIDLDPEKISTRIFQELKQKLIPGQTLVFLDEIQECPEAILAMRYFYERMPGLHIIGAGSLLEFLLNSGKISIPVGRIDFLFLGPMSFCEFLLANYSNDPTILNQIKSLSLLAKHDEFFHNNLLKQVKKYFYVGGMPAVVDKYLNTQSGLVDQAELINQELAKIIYSYRKDFGKYANLAKQKYLEAVFIKASKQIAEKFVYSQIDKELSSKELKVAYELLLEALVMHKVSRTSAAGLPLEAYASAKHFKNIYLDIGIAAKILGTDQNILDTALKEDDFHSIAQGPLTEQFVGQELLVRQPFYEEAKIYYWARDVINSSAEVDYVINHNLQIYPIEVKAGVSGKLKSLRMFLEEYKAPFGIRISTRRLAYSDGILDVPLYAIQEIPRFIDELFLNIHDFSPKNRE